jgi:hypothetical protein
VGLSQYCIPRFVLQLNSEFFENLFNLPNGTGETPFISPETALFIPDVTCEEWDCYISEVSGLRGPS